MNGKAVLENVRKYRIIASLHRQTAAFRPGQSSSLLGQAMEWERRAVAELEAYFTLRDNPAGEARPRAGWATDARWQSLAAA